MNATTSLPVHPAQQVAWQANLLHGAFAIPDQRRGYTVVDVQQGVITALDDVSTTVTSPDGFTRTYLVGEPDRLDAGMSRGMAITAGCRVVISSHDGVEQIIEVSAPSPDVVDRTPGDDALLAAER